VRGEKFQAAASGSTLLKGGGEMQQKGGGESGDAWSEAGERERARARQQMARAAGIGPRLVGAGGGVAVLQRRAVGHARLTGGTGRPLGPAGSDVVRGGRDSATRR
jgi:hypothetical protein